MGLAVDVSNYGYFQRGAVKEMMAFVARTVAKRTQPGQRQSVQQVGSLCYCVDFCFAFRYTSCGATCEAQRMLHTMKVQQRRFARSDVSRGCHCRTTSFAMRTIEMGWSAWCLWTRSTLCARLSASSTRWFRLDAACNRMCIALGYSGKL